MGPGLGAVAVFVIAILLAIVFGFRSERARIDAFEGFAVGAGLQVMPKGSEGREGLASLPGLPGPGRLVFSPVARTEGEVFADVRVTKPQKEVRTDRQATLVAWRRPDADRLARVVRSAEILEHVDPSPTGFGRLRIADDGVWVLCRTISKRVPDDRLAEFREYARQLVADRLDVAE